MAEKGPISISLAGVLRDKLGKRAERIPGWVVRGLENLICQDRMNGLLRKVHPCRGAAFCEAVLRELDVEVEVLGARNLPESPRAVFVCNHPLGGLDGIAIIAELSRRYGPGLHFVVNDMLMAIEPLRDVFVPVNKHGAQSRGAASALEEALEGDGPVVIFPAGLCSRRGPGGKVADLEWKKMFVTKAIASGRPVVPMFFSGVNSPFFYNFARLRERLGIRLNIEMVRLPREVFRAQGSRFRLYCGRAVDVGELASRPVAEEALRIRNIVYSLPSSDIYQ